MTEVLSVVKWVVTLAYTVPIVSLLALPTGCVLLVLCSIRRPKAHSNSLVSLSLKLLAEEGLWWDVHPCHPVGRASSQPPVRSTSTCLRVSVRLSWTAHSMQRPYSIAWPPRIGFVLLGTRQCRDDNCKTSGIRSHAFPSQHRSQFNVGLADHFDLLTGLDATKMVDHHSSEIW